MRKEWFFKSSIWVVTTSQIQEISRRAYGKHQPWSHKQPIMNNDSSSGVCVEKRIWKNIEWNSSIFYYYGNFYFFRLPWFIEKNRWRMINLTFHQTDKPFIWNLPFFACYKCYNYYYTNVFPDFILYSCGRSVRYFRKAHSYFSNSFPSFGHKETLKNFAKCVYGLNKASQKIEVYTGSHWSGSCRIRIPKLNITF